MVDVAAPDGSGNGLDPRTAGGPSLLDRLTALERRLQTLESFGRTRLQSDADGNVTLLGNLALASGKTVDGVDVSSHRARHDAGGADALTTVPIHDHSGDTGDGGVFLPQRHGCLLTKSTTQSIPKTTPTAVTFDQEVFDVGGLHSNTVNSSRITIVQSGIYLLVGHVVYNTAVGGVRKASLVRNGSLTDYITDSVHPPASGDWTGVTTAIIIPLAAGNYVELYAYQSTGGAVNIMSVGAAGNDGCYFSALLLAAT